jgi:hypothetical protein
LIERSDVGFVSGDALSVDEKTGSGGLLFYPPFRLGFFHRSGLLAQPTVFWRREVYEVCGGFDESLQFVGDWEYWARIGERYQAGKLNEVLALWRIHTEAKTVAQMSLLLREWNEVKGRYVPVGSFGYRILALVDRIYYFLWRRYCLLRFVWEYGWGRESVTPDNRAWTAFLACNASSIRLSATIGALLPVMGRHFSRRMVRVDPRFYGE